MKELGLLYVSIQWAFSVYNCRTLIWCTSVQNTKPHGDFIFNNR